MPYHFKESSTADHQQESRSERQVDLSGAASGYGGYCPEGIPVETAIFGILGAFGVAFGILYRAVTLKTARRRKRNAVIDNLPISGQTIIADMAWSGKKNSEHTCGVPFIFVRLYFLSLLA